MKPIRCLIPGKPMPAPRPRARAMKTRRFDPKTRATKPVWIAQVYMPADYMKTKEAISKGLRVAMEGHQKLIGPVFCTLVFGHECLSSDRRVREPAPAKWRDWTPDGDNLRKTMMDAANGIVWHDDAQVALEASAKIQLPQDWPPGVLLIAESLQTPQGQTELDRYTELYRRAMKTR